jgi:hypothetical protein
MAQDFTIVFQKATEAQVEMSLNEPSLQLDTSAAELDEIAELRRIVLEISDPEPMSYTTT